MPSLLEIQNTILTQLQEGKFVNVDSDKIASIDFRLRCRNSAESLSQFQER